MNDMPADLYNRLQDCLINGGTLVEMLTLADEIKNLYGASARKRAEAEQPAVDLPGPDPVVFGLVTRWKVPGKRPIVHIWGPYPTRQDAINGKAKALRAHLKDPYYQQDGEYTVHVCAMTGRLDAPPRYAQWS